MPDLNDAILQAIQDGFARNKRQLTDLTTSISRVENKIVNVDADLAEIKTRLGKVENRMHTVDSRLKRCRSLTHRYVCRYPWITNSTKSGD